MNRRHAKASSQIRIARILIAYAGTPVAANQTQNQRDLIDECRRQRKRGMACMAYGSFKEMEDVSRLVDEKQAFDIGEDIMASISETVKKTSVWMAKP